MRPVSRVKMCDLDKAEYLEFETLEFNQTFSPNNLVPFQNTQEIWLKSFPSYWRYLGVLLSPMYMQCTRDVLLYVALMEGSLKLRGVTYCGRKSVFLAKVRAFL